MFDRLTKKDIEKMEQEIEHRKLVVRRQALEDVKEARAQGDLSENFEYKAAKKFKNENESLRENNKDIDVMKQELKNCYEKINMFVGDMC